MISWPVEAMHQPRTFQAAMANQANAPRGMNPFVAVETISSLKGASTRQELLLDQQQQWIEHQRKIFRNYSS